MECKRCIHNIQVHNVLSYGREGEEIELQPLNGVMGPNCSGKSNLMEASGLFQETPGNLTAPIVEGGGVSEWLWKGEKGIPTAEIEAIINYPQGIMPLRYKLGFTMVHQRLDIVDEVVENENRNYEEAKDVYFFYRYQNGRPILNVRTIPDGQAGTETGRTQRHLHQE